VKGREATGQPDLKPRRGGGHTLSDLQGFGNGHVTTYGFSVETGRSPEEPDKRGRRNLHDKQSFPGAAIGRKGYRPGVSRPPDQRRPPGHSGFLDFCLLASISRAMSRRLGNGHVTTERDTVQGVRPITQRIRRGHSGFSTSVCWLPYREAISRAPPL
jgi:hypothetical protein